MRPTSPPDLTSRPHLPTSPPDLSTSPPYLLANLSLTYRSTRAATSRLWPPLTLILPLTLTLTLTLSLTLSLTLTLP